MCARWRASQTGASCRGPPGSICTAPSPRPATWDGSTGQCGGENALTVGVRRGGGGGMRNAAASALAPWDRASLPPPSLSLARHHPHTHPLRQRLHRGGERGAPHVELHDAVATRHWGGEAFLFWGRWLTRGARGSGRVRVQKTRRVCASSEARRRRVVCRRERRESVRALCERASASFHTSPTTNRSPLSLTHPLNI